MKDDDDDGAWMGEAIAEAKLAAAHADVPVGAIVVLGGVVVARGHNRRELDADPTAHAELLALRAAAKQLGHWRVEGTLVVTQEPCPMCAGAIVNARVARLVYGCANPKAGAIDSLFQLATSTRLNHRVEVVRGVRSDECASLLKDFFAALRRGPSFES
jgi:tRNA(adenine34) deaminase|nr:nucleoside deaminase [Kofleriaceae bacterium]